MVKCKLMLKILKEKKSKIKKLIFYFKLKN